MGETLASTQIRVWNLLTVNEGTAGGRYNRIQKLSWDRSSHVSRDRRQAYSQDTEEEHMVQDGFTSWTEGGHNAEISGNWRQLPLFDVLIQGGSQHYLPCGS